MKRNTDEIFLGYIPVKPVCIVIALLNIVFWSICFPVIFFINIYFGIIWIYAFNGSYSEIPRNDLPFLTVLVLCVFMFVSISLAFAGLFVHGMQTKKSKYVLAYLIYGILVDVALLSTVGRIYSGPWDQYNELLKNYGIDHSTADSIVNTVFTFAVIHFLSLVLVQRVYCLLRRKYTETGHKKIVENYFN